MKTKVKIDTITLHVVEDENPDLSELERTPEDHYGDDGSNWVHVSEEDQTKLIEKFGSLFAVSELFARLENQRLEEYYAREWIMLGIYAEATVSYPIYDEGGLRREETFYSTGMWGLESDSEMDYLWVELKEQIWDLQNHLKLFGITDRTFFKQVLDATEGMEIHVRHIGDTQVSTFLLQSQVFHNTPIIEQ